MVFQVSYRNRCGHPYPQIWQRYVARDIDGLRMDKAGAVVIQTDGDVLDIQTARAMRPRYRFPTREVDPLVTAAGAFDAPL